MLKSWIVRVGKSETALIPESPFRLELWYECLVGFPVKDLQLQELLWVEQGGEASPKVDASLTCSFVSELALLALY